MSSTVLDLDLATLVGEMEDVACESMSHGDSRYSDVHEGPATHYARVTCDYCHMNKIKAYCGPFIAYVIHPDNETRCECGVLSDSGDVIQILGPVNGRSS